MALFFTCFDFTPFCGTFSFSLQKLISLNEILQARSPINILRKGYAIVKDDNDNLLKSVEDFKNKENINITLRDGYVKGSFTLTERGGDL